MLFYVFLLLFCACIFGLCFLIDRLIQRLTGRNPQQNIVRQPRRAVVFGIMLLIAGIALLFYTGTALWIIADIVLLLLGLVLIGSYFLFAIDYDSEGFTCRVRMTRSHYRYNQIRGEQVLATRSGIAVILYVDDTTVELSEAMYGVREFLSRAYYARCRQLGIDPEDAPPPAPDELFWFPPPPDDE